jgi:Cu/Ag efflux protein CusF
MNSCYVENEGDLSPRLSAAMQSVLIFLSFFLVVGACQPPAAPERQSGTGIVQKVILHDRRVIVAHSDMPGFMPAMTMSFEVKDPGLLQGLRPGEQIGFVVERTKETLYLVQVKSLQTGSPVPAVP